MAFRPWIGSRYDSTSPKVLVVGESHYGIPVTEREATTEIVRRQFGEGKDVERTFERYRSLSAIERAIAGRQDLRADLSRDFWDSISLYNFVQAELSDVHVRPTSAQFSASVDAFCDVVLTLEPDVVVVFGTQTWRHLPEDSRLQWKRHAFAEAPSAPRPQFKRTLEFWTARVTVADRKHLFWCTHFPHPAARGFGSGLAWNLWVTALLGSIRDQQPATTHGA